jgi:signal transduction histidine kinase
LVLQQLTALRSLFRNQSGRVIALGRIMLCMVLLVAISLDRSEPEIVWVRTSSLLILFAALSVLIAALTWRNWWLDARLALISHGMDMAVFTAIVFSANTTTSPFFLFFVLPLLSSAIRWSWRETALTATVMVVLYMIAGSLVAGSESFELEKFVLRAGNLVILSLLLIWFGIHQRRTNLFFRADKFEAAMDLRDNPMVRGLEIALRSSGAGAGALMIGPAGEEPTDGFAISGAGPRGFNIERPLIRDSKAGVLLFDIDANRALTRPFQGRFRFLRAADAIDVDEARKLGLGEGVAAEVHTGTQHGWLILWDVPDLSADYLELGRELGRVAGTILDRHALLAAIETGAAARTRLSLARDVHDGIVQFLAGAAFRIEAIRRAARAGAEVDGDLDELKRLFVEEQAEIRGFLMALRRDREVELAEAIAELRALAQRLSQQWSVDCCVTADDEHASIPIRLQLDLQQMLREAVANAVRHGGAKRIEVGLAVEHDQLQLSVADNGSGFPSNNGGAASEPWSLKERVERANGSLRLVSAPGKTNILISLPLGAAA